jgi:hypothetical protein
MHLCSSYLYQRIEHFHHPRKFPDNLLTHGPLATIVWFSSSHFIFACLFCVWCQGLNTCPHLLSIWCTSEPPPPLWHRTHLSILECHMNGILQCVLLESGFQISTVWDSSSVYFIPLLLNSNPLFQYITLCFFIFLLTVTWTVSSLRL